MNETKKLVDSISQRGEHKLAITDALVVKLMKEKEELQKKLNPILKRIEKTTQPLDPYFKQITQLREKIKELEAEMKPFRDAYEVEAKKTEAVEAQARAIDNKVMPIIMDILKPQLEEFEEARTATLSKGVVYVTVVDKMAEFIRNTRARKAKK